MIREFRAEIDLGALNRGVQGLVPVQIRPLQRRVIDGFPAAAAEMSEVLSVFIVAGNEDFLIHVAVPDLDHLHSFLVDRLSERREVISFRSSVIFQHVHNPVLEPFPEVERPM